MKRHAISRGHFRASPVVTLGSAVRLEIRETYAAHLKPTRCL